MKLIFLAHDAGGYDVIIPIYTIFCAEYKYDVELLLTGESGNNRLQYKKTEEEVLRNLELLIKKKIQFVLITGTSWSSNIELLAIKICKENHIYTISILDYWANYKERFKLGDEYIFPDKYFVMDELALKEATESGVDQSSMVVVGHPGLDYYLKRKISVPRQDKILFLSQPLSDLYGGELGYTEFETFDDVLVAGENLGYQVGIKFHPRDTAKMKDRYGKYKVDGDLEKLIHDFSIVVGMNSMGLLKCALMGGYVVSYQPGLKKKDCCITNKLGITKGAFCYSELIDRLKFREMKKDDFNVPIWFDGESTERCTREIIKLCY